MIDVDVTPGKHSFLDALASISFKLGCGCRTQPSRVDDDAIACQQKGVGSTYPCSKHGGQIITRATQRLAGWRKPPNWRRG